MKYSSTILRAIFVSLFMIALSVSGHSAGAGKKNCPPDANVVLTKNVMCVPFGLNCYFGSSVPVLVSFVAAGPGNFTAVSNTGNSLTDIQIFDGVNFVSLHAGDPAVTMHDRCGTCYQVSIFTNGAGCSTVTIDKLPTC